MPIDASIYNMVGQHPQFELPDPLERQTRLAQLKQLAMQGEMGQMQLGEAKAKQAKVARVNTLLSQHGGDVQKAAQAAKESGDYETANELGLMVKNQMQTDAVYQKSVAEWNEAKAKLTKADRENVLAGLQDLNKGIGWVEEVGPEERPARWATFIRAYPPEVREKYGLSDEYNPDAAGFIRARARVVNEDMKPTSTVGKIMDDWRRGHYGTGPEAIQLRDAAIKDATTKQPAVQVGLGGVESGVDAEGNPVFFQPRKAGGAAEVIPNVKPAPKADAKRREDPGTAAAILDEAEKLVRIAPGSLIGAGGALVQRGVGVSTKASQAQAQLNALQASLMMRMPRMEGPQSDKDVALYREQAGRIADPTIPAGDKIAAIKSIRNIVTKYSAKTAGQGKVSLSEVQKAIAPGGKYAGKTIEQVKAALKSRGIEVE